MASPNITEGMIPFTVHGETFETYYKLVGEISPSAHPLITLHGGPGISHDSLLSLADLTSQYPPTAVILYDQLGSGRSTHLPHKDMSFWSIDLFIDEIENIISYFGVGTSYDLLGHSWGATLAAEFVVRRQPKGLRRLVLQGALASAKLRNEAGKKLRKQLAQEVQDELSKHEEAGTTSTPEYRQAMKPFWEHFGCRLKPPPPEVVFSMSQPDKDGTVLKAMRDGETGLADKWDITDRIHLMRHVPTLLINGEYDFMTDEVSGPFYWGIDKIKWVKFANSSHMPHWEERERFIQVVGDFLQA